MSRLERLPASRALAPLFCVAASAVLLLVPGAARAATITVGSGGDDGPAAADDGDCTLREAIEASAVNSAVDACAAGQAGSADTIRFSVGVVTLDEAGSGEDSNQDGDLDVAGGASGVTIDGGTSRVTIDANGIERVLDVLGGSVTVRNMIVREGNSADAGGGIRSVGALTVTGSDVTANTAQGAGGGISQQDGSLSVTASRVSGNVSLDGPGGGIDIAGVPSALTVDDTTIEGNDAGLAGGSMRVGGGISSRPALDTTLVVTDSSIAQNDAFRQGGGIALQEGGGLDLSRTRVVSNRVVNSASGASLPPVSGGGLADTASSAPLRIADSQFSGNSTTAGADVGVNNGGGAKLTGPSTVVRTTFNANSVTGGEAGTGPSGGGLFIQSGTTNLVNVTVSSNLATSPGGDGGGLDTGNGSGTVKLFNVTSAGNDADDEGDGIRVGTRTLDLRASAIDDGCGVTGATFDSGGNVEPGDTCGLNDGIGSAIDLGPLQDNGGTAIGVPGALQPRLTRAVPLGSAALDHVTAGCVDELGAPLNTDGRGLARPLDGDGNGSAVCDAGAYEKAAPPPPPPPPTNPPTNPPPWNPAAGCPKNHVWKWVKCVLKNVKEKAKQRKKEKERDRRNRRRGRR